MIEGQCPACRRVFKVDDCYAGMTGRCRTCGAVIHVPGERDEGLDGLPPPPASPESASSAPPRGEPPPPPPRELPPASAAATPERTAPAPASVPEPAQGSPGGIRPPAAQQPHPADELTRPHDARARFEPSEGPTPLKGPWVRETEPDAPPEPTAEVRREARAPQPAKALLADRYITPPEPEPAPTQHRPALLRLACAVICLLGIAFALHFVTAGPRPWGVVAAGTGVALAGLAVVRLWMAHWDGLLAGLLFCLGVAASARVKPDLFLANRILLGASALALMLLVLAMLRRSGRDYFTR